MTFSTPLFLLGLTAAAIPVLLHLISRRTRRELPFPTLRFIRISEQKTRRRRRIQDLLLLILRVAAFVLLTMALAGPTLMGLRPFSGDGHQTAVVVILDNSPGMAVVADGVPRLETAKAYAQQIIEPLDPASQVAILLTSGTPLPGQGELTTKRETIDGIIQRSAIGGEASDLPAWIRRAKALLVDSRATNRMILIVSDQRATSWNFAPEDAVRLEELRETPDGFQKYLAAHETGSEKGDTAGTGEHTENSKNQKIGETTETIPIFLVGVTGITKANAAIREVRVRQSAPLPDLPIDLVVTVAETSGVAQDRYVELWVDGIRTQTSPALPLDPYGTADWTVSVSFPKAGDHRGELRLSGDDGAKIDDSRYFVTTIAGNLHIGVLTAQRHEIESLDSAFYLERALRSVSEGGAIVTERFVQNMVTPADLNPQRIPICFCVDLPSPESGLAEALKSYVLQGGKLVWIPGDAVDPAAYDVVQQASGSVLLPISLGPLRIAAQELVETSQNSANTTGTTGTANTETRADISTDTPADTTVNLQAAGRDSWTLAWVDSESSIFDGLTDPPSLYQSVLVYRTMGIRPRSDMEIESGSGTSNETGTSGGTRSGSGIGNVDATGARILARLNDDTPLFVVRSIGAKGGRTYLWTGGIQLGWTNLPLKKIFPAFILRLVSEETTLAMESPTGIYCGVPVRREAMASTEPKFVEIEPPRGERLRFAMETAASVAGDGEDTANIENISNTSNAVNTEEKIQRYTFTQTSVPGIWSFRTLGVADPKPITLAVNIDPSETYPQTLSNELLVKILAPDPVVYSSNAQELEENLRKLREGTNLEDPLLYAVFLTLIVEAFFANRRGGREEEPVKGISPSERTIRAKDLPVRI